MAARCIPLCLAVLCGSCSGLRLLGQESPEFWSRFRGPNGGGVLAASKLPAELSAASVLWKTPLGGSGHSSPVLWGDSLFTVSYAESAAELVVEAFACGGGERLWQWRMPLAPAPHHRMNSPAAGTPVVDAERIYILAAEPGHVHLIALDHSGKLAWQRDFGPWRGQHGFAASPLVWDSRLYFLLSQESVAENEPAAHCEFVAVDVQSGEIVWRSELAAGLASYCAPSLWRGAPDSAPCLIAASTGEGLFALDSATGRRLWHQPCFSQRTVGSPVVQGNWIFGNNGSGNGGNYLVAVELVDGQPQLRYEIRQQMGYVPTVLPLDSQLYVLADAGVLSCLDLARGDVLWQERLPGRYFASPISDGRHLYVVNTSGELTVMAVGNSPRVVARLALDEPCQATPAAGADRLYVRTAAHLLALGEPAAGRSPNESGGR